MKYDYFNIETRGVPLPDNKGASRPSWSPKHRRRPRAAQPKTVAAAPVIPACLDSVREWQRYHHLALNTDASAMRSALVDSGMSEYFVERVLSDERGPLAAIAAIRADIGRRIVCLAGGWR